MRSHVRHLSRGGPMLIGSDRAHVETIHLHASLQVPMPALPQTSLHWNGMLGPRPPKVWHDLPLLAMMLSPSPFVFAVRETDLLSLSPPLSPRAWPSLFFGGPLPPAWLYPMLPPSLRGGCAEAERALEGSIAQECGARCRARIGIAMSSAYQQPHKPLVLLRILGEVGWVAVQINKIKWNKIYCITISKLVVRWARPCGGGLINPEPS